MRQAIAAPNKVDEPAACLHTLSVSHPSIHIQTMNKFRTSLEPPSNKSSSNLVHAAVLNAVPKARVSTVTKGALYSRAESCDQYTWQTNRKT